MNISQIKENKLHKKHLDVSPAHFRKNSEQYVNESSFSNGITLDKIEEGTNNITIEHIDSFTVIYERIKGNYRSMKKEWCDFIEKYCYLATKDTLYVECTIDDPSITNEDNCMYELCQTISPKELAKINSDDILTHEFEGGKYAVYHFKGYPDSLFMVYQEMICRWLTKTKNQLDEKPVFDIYRDIRDDGFMEIDICFPIKSL